jgi:HPt (histidine-containing phosphotransfer) domain-containing protein
MASSDPSPIFSSLAGDADMIELVQAFVINLQDRVAAMADAFQSNNVLGLSQLAHQLKGAGGGYGFDVISAAAADLEAAAKTAESVEQVRKELDELVILCHRATASPPPA